MYFGQSQIEIERLLSVKASPSTLPIARPGIDYDIMSSGFALKFDTSRLVGITFERNFAFSVNIAPFPEPWRDFAPLGSLAVKKNMHRDEFMAYLNVWEGRAYKSGARRKVGNSPLAQNEYSVGLHEDRISISFGPDRQTKKGGTWGSSYHIHFMSPRLAALAARRGQEINSLDSISVFCDEFNTFARSPGTANKAPEPTTTSFTSPAAQEPRQP